MREFHENEVRLNKAQQDEMRDRRNANRNRLGKNEFTENGESRSQGSYSMHTMVQDTDNDYDIDDGIVFEERYLNDIDEQLEPLDVRNKVKDAVMDGSFNIGPEVKKTCVRVRYNDGSHIDIPAYRKREDGTLELAKDDEWIVSDPAAVTEWFKREVMSQSKDEDNGRQLRRVVKLLKFIKNSRPDWKSKMPSGLIISALVVECYVSDDRDDRSLFYTMQNICERLQENLEVYHPVLSEEKLTKGEDDSETKILREVLENLINELNKLLAIGCTEEQAYKCWYKVFCHKFWENKDIKATIINIASPIAITKPYREF